MPRAGMDAAAFAALADGLEQQCIYQECNASVIGANYVIASSVPIGMPEDASAEQNARDTGVRIGEAVLRHTGDVPVSWVRDRHLWLDVLDCDAIGAAITDATGRGVEVHPSLEIDPPRLWVRIEDRAVHASDCYVLDASDPTVSLLIRAVAGMAWSRASVAQSGYAGPRELGTKDVVVYESEDGTAYLFADETNRVDVYYDPLGPMGSVDRIRAVFSGDLVEDLGARVLAGEFSS